MKVEKQVLSLLLVVFSIGGFSQEYERYMQKAGRRANRLFLANCKGADKYYTKAIELDSSNYEAFWQRGRLRSRSYYCFPELSRQDLQIALELINHQLSINPIDTLYWDRGFVNMYLTSSMQKTCADFKLAGKLGQRSYDYYCSEGE